MTGKQKVDAQLFGGDRRPVRRLAGNESVDSFRRNAFDLTPGGTSDHADGPNVFPARRDSFYRIGHCLFQALD